MYNPELTKTIKKMLVEHNPYLKTHLESEEYMLSKKILNMRTKKKLGELKASKVSNVRYSDYIDIEKGSLDVPISVYEEVLKKLTDY